MLNYYLAMDIGASSGRHILFWLEDGKLRMEEIYRFPNGMTEKNGYLRWDYTALETHILAGMKRCAEIGKVPVSVGIDTWGVDFVLLDEDDKIIGDTVGYRCKVVLPATHDTASAILAMPCNDPNTVYISSGTWSLLGVELPTPDCGEESREANFTNEGGFGGKICYLKNIMGLWMIQSVRKELAELGTELSFAELCAQAETESISSIISCNDVRFLAPRSMIQEIQIACREAHQAIPETPGEIARVVYRSLAKCYGQAIEQLRNSRKKDYRSLSILGGGNAEYLNRLTADETGCTVYAGPGEATAIGNALAQMISSGECQGIDHARSIAKASFDVKIPTF